MSEQVTPTPAQEQPVCKPWQSKTLWIALIMSAVAFVPSVSEWIKANPELFTAIMGSVFAFLRVISKDKIVIK